MRSPFGRLRASNRRGLSAAGDADRALWGEFAENVEEVAAEAQEAFARIEPEEARVELVETVRPPSDGTNVEVLLGCVAAAEYLFTRVAGLSEAP